MTRRIKKRKTKSERGKGEYLIYSINIPGSMAVKIPENMRFEPELTEEGILFRPVLLKKEVPLPTWCLKETENAET